MCGIAGKIQFDRQPLQRELLMAMGARLSHRGPDDSGVYVKGHAGLAHQRLSILDLSEAGHQPMSNAQGNVWIVFNGEIYNFEELRGCLRTPRNFRTRTDTEVLLYLYEDYGVQCLSMLRGMFAFAVWDEAAQRLIVARDRIGKKPLFYRVTDTSVSFASELKALLVEPSRPEIDPVALNHYLTFQYIPAPLTIYRGIKKLLPGQVMVCDQGKISFDTYWSLQYDRKVKFGTEEEYLEAFKSLLDESVRLRLVSDVPLGAFLSGGLDSSSIVAVMSRCMTQPVKTFSIGFKEEAFNELPYAREIAQQFSTDHHEFIVEPSALEILPKLVRVYDEPYADSSAIPTYYLSQLSRQSVTVVLNGDGGDEALAGYPRYNYRELERWMSRYVGKHVRESLKATLLRVPLSLLPRALRQIAERACDPFAATYLNRICYFSPRDKTSLYTPEFSALVQGHDSFALLNRWFEDAPIAELLDQMLAVDIRSYLPDDLLVKVDRSTMAHGLEARSPFLDHKLLEFTAALPIGFKVRNGESKYLLKWAMRGVLPKQIITRRKQGFGVPIDRWFREDCRDYVRDTLLSSRSVTRGYFSRGYIQNLLDEHQQRGIACGYKLYALLMLELWHCAYVDDHANAGSLAA
ncbi:MAG: asparagine synthase (glutamine-hydrolyzing) [Nitrospira sp.]|nr:asparagine synthase (glutamine-hydrolyzing) [Nitrospira sp.]